MTIDTTAAPDDSSEETVEPGTALMAAPLAETPSLDASNPVHFELMDRLGKLEEALLIRDPLMKVHLAAIHKQLIGYEELVHLLTDEQIGKIVAGQQAHTNTTLAVEVSSKAGKAKVAARAAKYTVHDL